MNTILRMRRSRASLPVLLALLLSACATTPRMDRDFGQSVRGTIAAQVVNPAASLNPNPVSGIDGRAARGAQQRYEGSYKEAQPDASTPSMLGTK